MTSHAVNLGSPWRDRREQGLRRLARQGLQRGWDGVVWAAWSLILAWSWPVWASASSTPWPDMPGVPEGHTEWIARDAWVNGIPSRIQRFESRLGVPAVLAHYRAHWAAGAPSEPALATGPGTERVREHQWNGWTLLSTWHGPFQLVLQVKPDGVGSQGLLSSIRAGEVKQRWLPAEWPRLPEALWTVQQVMESVDGPLRSFHLLARSDKPQEMLRHALANAWHEAGWQLQNEQAGPAGYLATYVREGKTLDMVLAREPAQRAVRIVIHWVEPLQAEEGA